MIRFTLWVLFLVLAGCGPKVIFEGDVDINHPLSFQDTIDFQFEVKDTISACDIILNIDHQSSYNYQNAYFKLITVFPNGEVAEDLTSFDLRKSNGLTNGKCNDDECSVPFLIQDDTYFKSEGFYTLKLIQHNRIDSISGLNRIKLKIIESEI